MFMLTRRVIGKLIRQSADRRKELTELYRRLPATRCQRKTYCCSMLPEHYRNVAARSREAKKYLQQQWQALDVTLPRAAIDFEVPYCLDVQTLENVVLNDVDMVKMAAAVESISLNFAEAHQSFRQNSYADFSFLVAAMLYGHRRAVQIKFDVVKEFVHSDQRKKLNRILDECVDPFKETADSWENHQGE
jgi:hypothetical protein